MSNNNKQLDYYYPKKIVDLIKAAEKSRFENFRTQTTQMENAHSYHLAWICEAYEELKKYYDELLQLYLSLKIKTEQKQKLTPEKEPETPNLFTSKK